MTTVIVDTVTLEFMNYWPSDMANPPIVTGPNPQVSLETSEDPLILMAVKDPESGDITLQEDPAKVQAKTAQAWTALRTERNSRLAASDWTQLQDTHLSAEKKSAWADYRQALRDLPDETTNPLEAEWPLDPTAVVQAPVSGSRLSNLLGGV